MSSVECHDIEPVEPARAAESGRPRWLARIPWSVKLGVPIAVLLLAGVAALSFITSQPTRLAAAVIECDLESALYASQGDDDTALTLDMEGEDDLGKLSYAEVFCVLTELDVPDRVTALMGATRSLDARQSSEWDGLAASWSYHPDGGLDVILMVG